MNSFAHRIRLGGDRWKWSLRRLPASRARFILTGVIASVIGAGLLAPAHAAAGDSGDPATGRALAQRWCSSCHIVGPSPQSAAAIGVPTFSAIARMSSTTPTSLRVFLQTTHGGMPDLHMTHDEIDDVAAYILSLKER